MERPILLNMKPREVEELFAMGQLAIVKKNRPSNYFPRVHLPHVSGKVILGIRKAPINGN